MDALASRSHVDKTTLSSKKRDNDSESGSSSPEYQKKCKKNKKMRSRGSDDDASRKKHKKSKRKKRSRSSSDSSDAWVEKDVKASKANDSYDWMNVESLIPTFSSNKEVKTKKDVNKCIMDAPGQTSRELNPYWKNGGTGLPSEEKDLKVTSSSVGDKGLEWYERALKRAEETAEKEGRSLVDVVSERWGSLEKLTQLISQAKSENEWRRDRDRGKQRGFRKPGEEFGREYHDRRDDRRKEWKKPSHSDNHSRRGKSPCREKEEPSSSDNHSRREKSPCREKEVPTSSKHSDPPPQNSPAKILTEEELNALAAKMVKAEILGKTEVVEKLKKQLAQARAAREEASNTVILMQTNKQGVNIPVRQPSLQEPRGGRRKDRKMETHSGGQRQRYFADDDDRDLRQMFEQEKLSTADDDKALFMKMAARSSGRGSDEEDAAFADAARISEASGKIQQREHDRAVHESQRRKKTLDGCQWCLDNSQRSKHLVVSIGETCYLCLPAEESLTSHHCLLVPIEHSPCGTQLDENVWEEMHRFRKAIVSMANELEQDVLFFEQARGLKNYPHMVLHCVVLDREIGSMAPIYFKKALLESESEWSDNKKVVDIKGPDVRRSVPKGLPYFAVEFPPQGGFAHVIEDEKLFPANFAHSIVGGMLDLDHRTWRKAHKITHAEQREKTLVFSKAFAKHDFNRKDRAKTSPSSSD